MTPNLSNDMQTSSEGNERIGLLDRVIENWLTSVNERQYQLPFCQVLSARGETILYVSSHGPFEKGKDIITRTVDGRIHAYQLKKGDVNLGEWREIYGEIVNLVELAIEIPGQEPITEFVPFIVTNGEFSDPVIEQIRVANVGWPSRGINKELRKIAKGELFELFREAHGAYLPRELSDFRTFLELILHDGSAPAEKGKAAQLIEHVLPADLENANALSIARAANSIALLTAYITGAATEWLRWKSADGILDSHFVDEPQSWSELRQKARNASAVTLPLSLVSRPGFALWYLLVFPHRFTQATAKLVDDAVANSVR